MRKIHEPKECTACGETFRPTHGNQTVCPVCRDAIQNGRGRHLPRTYDNPKNIEAYENDLRCRYMERFRDTIVAIGYAERQKAATLAMVGKVRTEL